MKKILTYIVLAAVVVLLFSVYYVNGRNNGKDVKNIDDTASEQNVETKYEKFSNFSYVQSTNKETGSVENGDEINFVWKGCAGVNDIVITAQSAFDGVNSKIYNIEGDINSNGSFSWMIPSDFPNGVFRVFISSDICASKSETDLRLEIQKPLEKPVETNMAFVFLEQIKEVYSVSGPIIPGEVMRGVSGHKINLDDSEGIEIEKYLAEHFQHSNQYVTQSSNGIYYYKDEMFCMNFGRTTSNNGPFLWCTNNKDIIK